MVTKQKRWSVLVILITTLVLLPLVLLLSGCSESEQDGSKPPEISYRMKWVVYGNYAGDVLGEKWGTWEKHGLDVTVQPGGPGISTTQLVAGGSDQFGTTGPDELALAIDRGLPLVAVAAVMQKTPIGYLVHPESDIYSPKDFAGKRFKVIPGHNSYYEYLILMNKFGVNRSDVEEITNKTSWQLWLANKVDIEPVYINYHVTQAEQRGYKYRLLRSEDFGIKNYGNVIFTTKAMVRENPEVVKHFIEGYFEAWEAVWNDPEKAIDALKEIDPSLVKKEEVEIAKTIKEWMKRDDNRWGWMERDRWQEQLDDFYKAGFIEKKLDADDVYTNRFIEEIYGEKN